MARGLSRNENSFLAVAITVRCQSEGASCGTALAAQDADTIKQ